MQRTRFRSIPSFRKGISQSAGRNRSGHITVRHRGGGHKQAIRTVQWSNAQKSKAHYQSAVQGVMVGFEYDPQRTTPLVKIYTPSKNEFSYKIATEKLKPLQSISTYTKNPQNFGDVASLSSFEPGDFIHSVELYPGQGPSVARSAGSFCQVRSNYNTNIKFAQTSIKNENETFIEQEVFNHVSVDSRSTRFVKVRLPSGSQRLISSEATGTFGIPQRNGYHQRPVKKAGRTRWYGWRPSVRGVARNPVDHPHGGGQGKTSGGRPSVTFKAWPTKGQPTRSPKRKNNFILVGRKKKHN